MTSKVLCMSLFLGRNVLKTNLLHKNLSSLGARLLSATVHKAKENQKSTVDADDVARHTKMLQEWWDRKGLMAPLHDMNLIRVPFIRDGLLQDEKAERSSTPLRGKKVLDVGCGGGILSEPLARLGASTTGIDASKELIAMAEEHSKLDPKLADNRPKYICSSIEDHSDTHIDFYDGVVISEVIEHVDNKELFVKCCVKVLKPGGRIFITTPNRTRFTQIAGIYIMEYVLNKIPRGTHQYEKFIKPNELAFLLERNGCHVEAIYGMTYNILNNKWSFINSQVLSYAMQAIKLK